MPCDSIVLTHTEFLPNTTDLDLLKQSLERMGFTVRKTKNGLTFSRSYREQGSYDAQTGRMELPQDTGINEVKTEYSRSIVEWQASQQGWSLDEWTKDDQGNWTTNVLKQEW